MKLYKITRIGVTDWDEYFGFVIAAQDESEARDIAATEGSYAHGEIDLGHRAKIWLDPAQSKIQLLADKCEITKPEIVLDSYLAG